MDARGDGSRLNPLHNRGYTKQKKENFDTLLLNSSQREKRTGNINRNLPIPSGYFMNKFQERTN